MLRQLLSLDETDKLSTKFNSLSEESSDDDFNRSRLASTSCNVSKNKGREIDFTSASVKDTQTPLKTKQSSCSFCTQKGMIFSSNPEAKKEENLSPSEPKESISKVLTKSKPRTVRFMVNWDLDSSSKKYS